VEEHVGRRLSEGRERGLWGAFAGDLEGFGGRQLDEEAPVDEVHEVLDFSVCPAPDQMGRSASFTGEHPIEGMASTGVEAGLGQLVHAIVDMGEE